MEMKKIYLIYRPTPIFGRITFMSVDGSNIADRNLYRNTVYNYMSTLQKATQEKIELIYL